MQANASPMSRSKPRAIHQFLAGFREGDAISNEAIRIRALFRAWGYASEIYCDRARTAPRLRQEVNDLAAASDDLSPEDVAFLHLSIGCRTNALFRELACRKALLYHNVTPAEYFRLINPALHDDLAAGRRQARELAGCAQVNLADSAFNARELESMGYRDVAVLPLLIDIDRLVAAPDPAVLRRLDDGCTNLLFVGRCVPNKRIEDLLTLFAHVQRHIAPASRFIHVGSAAGTEAYQALLMSRAQELGLRNVLFTGPVSQAGLNAYYDAAQLFVCFSEHEGFCVPLLEAMVHALPIIALDRAAVGETLDGAGVLLQERDYPLAAEAIGRLLNDPPFRQALLKGQAERLDRYRKRDLAGELRNHLAPLLSE